MKHVLLCTAILMASIGFSAPSIAADDKRGAKPLRFLKPRFL